MAVAQSGTTLSLCQSQLSRLNTSALHHPLYKYQTLTSAPIFWHHIAFTIYREDLAVYVNGSVVRAVGLQGAIMDEQGLTSYLGQTSPGVGFYQGLIQDPFFYIQSLTQR